MAPLRLLPVICAMEIMLESLYIKDLVLVPQLQVDFSPGFNTVTGETGAGKSLIIGALQLLSGGRASSSLVRRGAGNCEVAGVFRLDGTVSEGTRRWLEKALDEAGLPSCEDGRLLMRRVVSETGSRGFINGSAVTAAVMRAFGEHLVDIHGPNENQSLLQPARQLHLLDLYGVAPALLKEVRSLYGDLMAARRDLAAARDGVLSRDEEELVEHQLQEIENAGLSEDEEETLLARHRSAASSARLKELAGRLSMALSGGETALTEQLAPMVREAEELAQLDGLRGNGFVERLNAVSEELSSLAEDLVDYSGMLEIDAAELQQMEERIALLQKLKRRFGPTVGDVLATADRLRARLSRTRNHAAEIARLEAAVDSGMAKLKEACSRLHRERQSAAARLVPAVEAKLSVLGFSGAHFEIRLENAKMCASGADSCEFYFAPNRGEECAALRHSASSGEVARVMLAIKSVLSAVDEMPVMVFDEIDANIGGRTAAAVAAELRAVAHCHQVFSITHLPLIAAAGETHYMVEKHSEEQRTVALMHMLKPEERVAELVRMLGAPADDAAALEHAREMLKNAHTAV